MNLCDGTNIREKWISRRIGFCFVFYPGNGPASEREVNKRLANSRVCFIDVGGWWKITNPTKKKRNDRMGTHHHPSVEAFCKKKEIQQRDRHTAGISFSRNKS
jgi:hypothetical protein